MANLKYVLGAIGFALLVGGMVIGFVPITVGDLDCGSAFFGPISYDAEECAVYTGYPGLRLWAFAMVGMGFAFFVTALTGNRKK